VLTKTLSQSASFAGTVLDKQWQTVLMKFWQPALEPTPFCKSAQFRAVSTGAVLATS
jgi:hypothetical protein